jgi:hypothetical protein
VTIRRFWPTIVGAAVLVSAGAGMWWAGLAPTSLGAGAASPVRPPNDPVRDYLDFAGGVRAGAPSTGALIVDGLRMLAGAVATMESTGPEVAIDLRVAAEHVLLSPDSIGTTVAVRESLLGAATRVEIDRGAAPLLLEAAESIDPQASLIQQRDELIRCFIAAADSLRRMKPAGAQPTT